MKASTEVVDIELMHPFISGDGKNFDTFTIYYPEDTITSGMVLMNEEGQLLRVMTVVPPIEDFFENIYSAYLVIMTNKSTDIVHPKTRILSAMKITHGH